MSPSAFRVFARALRAAADVLEDAATEAATEKLDWQAQQGSPLGNRRHISAVRRRMAEGLEGAAQVGRRYLLSPEALREELGRPAPRPKDSMEEYEAYVRREIRAAMRGAA